LSRENFLSALTGVGCGDFVGGADYVRHVRVRHPLRERQRENPFARVVSVRIIF
jgi:hypothetical protein